MELDIRELALYERWEQLMVRLDTTLSRPDDLLLEAHKKGAHGNTVLHHLAMRTGPKEVVFRVIGACQEARLKAFPLCEVPPQLCAVPNRVDRVPLHYAAALCNDVDVVKRIIDDFPGAVLFRDRFNRTPLSFAMDTHLHRPERLKIIALLLYTTLTLNTQNLQLTVKLCVSALKKQGLYQEIRSTPNNELTKAQFAFKVIEMMMSCKMEPLAEQLISFVSGGKDSGAVVDVQDMMFEHVKETKSEDEGSDRNGVVEVEEHL